MFLNYTAAELVLDRSLIQENKYLEYLSIFVTLIIIAIGGVGTITQIHTRRYVEI